MILPECVQQIVIDDLAGFIINLSMALIALISAVCAFLAYKHTRNRSSKDAACQLASHYANVILKEYRFISNVYKRARLDNYIKNTISINNLDTFDREELTRLLEAKQLDFNDFIRKVNDIDPKIILNCKLLCSESYSEREIYASFLQTDSDGQERILNESYLVTDLLKEITDLLNQLEWFGMNCRYRLADEEVLYQSLHQTYLSMVWMLYPIISMHNTSNEDKMFTNLIWLFKKWRARLSQIKGSAEKKRLVFEKQARKATAKAEKASKKADQAKKIADHRKKQADKTKAEVFSGKEL